jgi:hypothetical protein
MYLAIDPDFVEYKLGYLTQAVGLRMTFDMGYKKVYGVFYNPASIKIH